MELGQRRRRALAERSMSWLINLIALFGLLLLVSALLSPFEAMGWWAGWTRRTLTQVPSPPPDQGEVAPYYVVYFTGVAGFSGDFLARRERGFLERLEAELPGTEVICDVFPFSVNNNPLDGDRLLRNLWSWLQARRLALPNNVFDVLIVVRNMFQFLVSADRRYGPVYNLGVAREVARRLRQAGFPVGSGQTLYLLAYSGGAQIAVGAAPFLKQQLGCRVEIVALGGVFSDDEAIEQVDLVHSLRGSRDYWVPDLGALIFPGRWRFMPYSAWNRTRRAGKIRHLCPGPTTHVGKDDYFSRNQVENTLPQVVRILRGH